MTKRISLAEAEGVARSVFAHDALRDHQRQILEAVFSGRDALIVAATGSGKSLCFQIPPVALGRRHPDTTWMVIVVSPLISLMRDQCAALSRKGVQVRAQVAPA